MKVLPESGKKDKHVSLDLRDKKILFLLSKDARTPITKIAKNVRLSQDSVKYRINKLKKQGVIKNSLMLIDIKQLGYEVYHLFLQLNNPSNEREDNFIRKIISLPYVRALLKFYGRYDFEVAVVAKDVYDLDRILNEIVEKAGEYLQEHEILAVIKNLRVGAFPNSFLKEKTRKITGGKKQTQKKYNPDKKDFKIMKVIRQDASMSLVDISTKVNLSPDAVSYRLKRLKEKIILSYVPTINYRALGYEVKAFLFNIANLNEEKTKKLSRFLATNDNILWGAKTMGKYNVLVYVCTLSDVETQKTIAEFRELFQGDIKSYDSLIAAAEYKYVYAPDCLF